MTFGQVPHAISDLLFRWERPLTKGILLRRRHRFLVDVELSDGSVAVAHCANTGCMEGLVRPGSEVWLSEATSSKRTLRWTWELIRLGNSLVGANSWTANRLVQKLLEGKALPGLRRFNELCTEPREEKGARFDFELISARGRHFIEVKNGHLVYPDGAAYFPDSLTVRSVKHLSRLSQIMREGHQATILVSVQRSDARLLRPSDIHDSVFASSLRAAAKVGLRVRALQFEPSLAGFSYLGEIPVDLKPYATEAHAAWRTEHKKYSGWSRPKGDPLAAWRKNPVVVRRELS